jgi:hypothetical protein
VAGSIEQGAKLGGGQLAHHAKAWMCSSNAERRCDVLCPMQGHCHAGALSCRGTLICEAADSIQLWHRCRL